MSVWYAIPSKRPPEQAEPVLKLWRERGYKIALLRDMSYSPVWEGFESLKIEFGTTTLRWGGRYPGYAVAVNTLAEWIIRTQPDAEWIVTGGDDVEPNANHSAEEIAAQCIEHFEFMHQAGELTGEAFPTYLREQDVGTWGVMQPTGDRWGDTGDGKGAYIDRVCGSPWLGREFCKRMYGGRGPFFEGYTHMGVDEELQAVASKLGVLWQRRDLIHYHRHWGRPKAGERLGDVANMPEFLKEANSPEHWRAYKKLFRERQAAGFPGHEPL